MTTARCPVDGDECVYVRAAYVIVDRGGGDATPYLEAALVGLIAPPYRVFARRREGDLWAIGAVRIQVAELPAGLEGEDVTLVVDEEGERSLTVDGRPTVVGIDALEPLVGGRFEAYVLRARRLDAAFWEFTVDPL